MLPEYHPPPGWLISDFPADTDPGFSDGIQSGPSQELPNLWPLVPFFHKSVRALGGSSLEGFAHHACLGVIPILKPKPATGIGLTSQNEPLHTLRIPESIHGFHQAEQCARARL